GIRDRNVTGVHTCALPNSARHGESARASELGRGGRAADALVDFVCGGAPGTHALDVGLHPGNQNVDLLGGVQISVGQCCCDLLGSVRVEADQARGRGTGLQFFRQGLQVLSRLAVDVVGSQKVAKPSLVGSGAYVVRNTV